LKASDILYDRDAAGEYLQRCSPTYGEDFFFAILQRCGYAGAGAPNAIFRIATLQRHFRPGGLPR
jgi:4-hydroxyphenylpyruvate dioxygenase